MSVSKCICGCSLRNSSVAIGFYYVVNGLATAALCFAAPSTLYKIQIEAFAKSAAVKGLLFGVGVVMLIQVLAGILLIFGAYKEKAVYLLPWVIYAWVFLALALAVTTIFIIRLWYTGNGLDIVIVVIEVLHIALLAYLLTVVHSYRTSLKEQTPGGDTSSKDNGKPAYVETAREHVSKS